MQDTLNTVTGSYQGLNLSDITGCTVVAYGGSEYGSSASYTCTEDCYLLCGGGGKFDVNSGGGNYIKCSGYTTLIAGGHRENNYSNRWYCNSGAWIVYAKKGQTVTCNWNYNGGGSAGNIIIKLNF